MSVTKKKSFFYFLLLATAGFVLISFSFLLSQHNQQNELNDFSLQSQVENSSLTFQNQCGTSGYMTVFDGGRLGNLMGQYATLLAHANGFGAKPLITQKMKNELAKHFPNLSITVIPNDKNCLWNWKSITINDSKSMNLRDSEERNFKIDQYILDLGALKFFRHHIVTKEFSFDPKIIRRSEEFLSSVASKLKSGDHQSKKIIFVSVHVRRTDYKEWLARRAKGQLASSHYIFEAMDYYREKYSSDTAMAVFIFASDDPKWCQMKFGHLEDVFFTTSSANYTSEPQPTFDLSVLTRCNHSIITYGSFGFWSAYLKHGGEVVLVKGSTKIPTFLEEMVLSNLPTWTFVSDPCFHTDKEGNLIQKENCD